MKAHEWMISYTRQSEWIDRRGLFLWLAFYFGGLGGGLYLVSLYFDSLWGMFISWLIIVVLKGGSHFLFLGKPLRFWRMIRRPHTSWLARGLLFVLLFTVFAAVQLCFSLWLPGSAGEVVFKVLAGLMAFAVAIYTGFVMNGFKAIPFWNSALLPVLFFLCGVLGGLGLSTIIAFGNGQVNIVAETASRWLLIINALLIVIYLWRATCRGQTGKQSVVEQIRGQFAPVFWAGVITMGIIIPVVIAFASYFAGEASAVLLVIGVGCEITGGLSLRYCILKAGAYRPLLKLSGV